MVCSISMFTPIRNRMQPPVNSAFDLNLFPKKLPKINPIPEKINVVTPINIEEEIISTLRNENVMPMARASMLVATAIIDIFFTEKSVKCSLSSFDNDSRIILNPIIERRINAIQWSMSVTYSENVEPR